jgi:outer membrane receptor protein involved in Fe transport
VLGGLNRLINIPQSRIAGGEIQVVWEPVKGLTVNGGATYIGSKILGNFTNYTLGRRAADERRSLPAHPKWQLTGDIGYDHPINSRWNGFGGVSATYQSETNAALGAEALYDVKAYALVDLRVGVHTADDRWRITGWIRNLNDAYYWTNVSYNGPNVAIRYAGMPRTFGVSAALRY